MRGGVTFFLAGHGPTERIEALVPDRDWREFVVGEMAWIAQTFLRLARAGHPVRLSDACPREGLVVFHTKQRRALRRSLPDPRGVILAAVRADNSESLIADFEVLQNGTLADGRRRLAMPHWPQPGLVPRAGARGTMVRNAAYKGFSRNLHPDLRSSDWLDVLQREGLSWRVDDAEFREEGTDASDLAWNDFSTVDVLVAVRPPDRRGHTSKPPTKLVNAWLAGVPAVLGREVAYRELRRSPLDYLEVSSLAEAIEAVRRLVHDPELYRAMVANGRERAEEWSVKRITEAWARLLFETIPALAGGSPRRAPLALRAAGRRLRRWASLRPAR
jgi:hypothetical protein